MVDTSGGLLRDTVAVLEELRVLVVDKGSKITTVVEDQVELLAILEGKELLLQTPVVLLLGLTLPGEANTVLEPLIYQIKPKHKKLTQGHRQRQWQRRHDPGWKRCCKMTR